MRSLAWVFAFAALGAFAAAPSDFSSSATVTPGNGDALQRFALPFAAYRDTRGDFADVRVFNANGEAVPIAFAGEPQSVFEVPRGADLPVFPLTTLVPAAAGEAGAEVTIRMQDGTLVAVHGRNPGAAKTAVRVAYLIDASRLEEPIAALHFGWDAAPGTEVVPISVEASDDLQSWRTVSHATLWNVTRGGSTVSQARAPLVPPSAAKYYRLTWSSAPAFRLSIAQGEYPAKTHRAPREALTVPGRAGDKPGEFVFDLGARLPVEALRIVPAESNSIASYAILSRNPPDTRWHYVVSERFYRLQRDEREIEAAPREIVRNNAREWMARVDAQTSGVGSAPPKLEVQWRGFQVVYVARGPGPFRLAFGNPDAKPAWVPVASLIPAYKPGDELKLPASTVGAVEGAPPARIGFLPARIAQLGPRKLALWATLILAVAILAFMAWRLHRQMRGK